MGNLDVLSGAVDVYEDSNENDKLVITNGEYVNLCDFSEEHENVEFILYTRENNLTRIWAYTTSGDLDAREAIFSYARNNNIDGLVGRRSHFLVEDLLF